MMLPLKSPGALLLRTDTLKSLKELDSNRVGDGTFSAQRLAYNSIRCINSGGTSSALGSCVSSFRRSFPINPTARRFTRLVSIPELAFDVRQLEPELSSQKRAGPGKSDRLLPPAEAGPADSDTIRETARTGCRQRILRATWPVFVQLPPFDRAPRMCRFRKCLNS